MTEKKKIIGLLVCNSQEVLDHKKRDGRKVDERFCYWQMARTPTRICDLFSVGTGTYSEPCKAPGADWIYAEDDLVFPDEVEVRLYFAVKGAVMGYFVCEAMKDDDDIFELRFFSDDWHGCMPIMIRPSQGWRYWQPVGT